jgi:hypothetical protein
MADLSARKIPKGDTGNWPETFDGFVDEVESGLTETENARAGHATLSAKIAEMDATESAHHLQTESVRAEVESARGTRSTLEQRQSDQDADIAVLENRLISAEIYLEANSDFDVDNPILINPSTITTNTTIAAGNNALSIGPMTTAVGVTIDITGTYTTI